MFVKLCVRVMLRMNLNYLSFCFPYVNKYPYTVSGMNRKAVICHSGNEMVLASTGMFDHSSECLQGF